LGGNLAGLLPYREAALPLLLADATLRTILPGRDGAPAVRRERRLRASFDKRLLLAPGELVLSFAVPLAATRWPWRHHRRTRTSPVDYPLVTLALVRDGPAVRFAVAGAHPYPFRSDAVDAALSRDGAGAVPAVVDALGPLRADARASAEYRAHLLGHLLRASLEELA
jgi:CO/xanthine dehydrogenase FAD-binding subunit